MRKKGFYVWSLVAALMMTACSEKEDPVIAGEKTSLEFAIDFGDIVKTRAQSTAVPVTSWAKSINKVQFFLYDVSGNIKYSAVVDPTTSTESPKKFVYTDVPVGINYTLVAVANVDAATDPISTSISGSATTWNSYNVRQKAIGALSIGYKSSSFPAFAPVTGATAYAAPSEVFMAYVTNVNVSSGQQTTLTTPLKLKREVSLLRARLNVKDTEADVNNTGTGAGGVDWTQNVSVLIYRLPNSMGIAEGNAGGIATTSTATNVIVDTRAWRTVNPTTTDYSSTLILTGNFEKWQDIVVFPNNGGRGGLSVGNDVKASVNHQYFIVVTALGKTGHVLANGNELTADTRIYWDGLIQEAFFPNYIREVNLTLKSGGKDGDLPTTPTEQGELIITVSDPEAWDSNILDTDIEL